MPYECVLKCGQPRKSSDTISQGKWDSLQLKAKNWSGIDKFGDVHGKMGRGIITCIKHVISQFPLQTSLGKPNSAKTKKLTLLSVPQQVLKCKLIWLLVMMRQRSHCQPSACDHLFLDLFTTKQNVYGACRV